MQLVSDINILTDNCLLQKARLQVTLVVSRTSTIKLKTSETKLCLKHQQGQDRQSTLIHYNQNIKCKEGIRILNCRTIKTLMTHCTEAPDVNIALYSMPPYDTKTTEVSRIATPQGAT